jgi:hypothetical protein
MAVPERQQYVNLVSLINNNRLSPVGRVEPKRTQGCLPKSCHSLNLGMENFASILNGRFWPIVTIRFVPEIIPDSCRSKSAIQK